MTIAPPSTWASSPPGIYIANKWATPFLLLIITMSPLPHGSAPALSANHGMPNSGVQVFATHSLASLSLRYFPTKSCIRNTGGESPEADAAPRASSPTLCPSRRFP